MEVARVPSYSPNAIAELSLTLAMMLLRNTAYTTNRTSFKNFIVDSQMFSREIRNCTVGVIGTGKIGLTEAKLFKGLGAKVIGYDVFESDAAKEVLEFKSLDALLAESDIVSIHVPYFPGKNDKMINAEFLSKMKEDAILINTARGELQDNEAILEALETNQIGAFGTDVFTSVAYTGLGYSIPVIQPAIPCNGVGIGGVFIGALCCGVQNCPCISIGYVWN